MGVDEMSVWRITYTDDSVTLLKATDERAVELATSEWIRLIDRVRVIE